MKVLVTGGAGFIGSNFVNRWYAGCYQEISEITVLDKFTYSGSISNLNPVKEGEFKVVRGDICDKPLVDSLMRGVDAVINFAAESHVDRSINSMSVFVHTNILGLSILLESARENGVTKFLQISTDEVYGSITSGNWTEESKLDPNSPYSASKASADLISQAFSRTHGLNLILTRSCNNYGPNQHIEKLIPSFITNLLRDKKVSIYGNGENRREWIHVFDNCDAIYLAFLKGEPGAIYNIGSEDEYSNLEITNMLLSELDMSSDYIEFVPDRKNHDFRYSVDFRKITALGYTKKVDFSEGLTNTITWYKNNEHWWRPLI